ncbi:pentapeptide repeat-containing protein [Pseudoduganella aquatica]|uniref:Pentapeptide repeat-containing protein n=1 Tax=Pseudoduganella aquatica TaxID=2660641 RepID=A0A7X4HFB8_9BURK|nr:pentapeptide repeat-containing protein [Pseudoduganella aquatica]MYN10221.1 hypothetical protein [Pseudoduganella aquatica]
MVEMYFYLIIILSAILSGFLDRKCLKFRDLDCVNGSRSIGLAASLRFRLFVGIFSSLLLLFSPFFAYKYPVISTISGTFEIGYLYVIAYALFVATTILTWAFFGGEYLSKSIFSTFLCLDSVFVLGMGRRDKLQYLRHGAWRWDVLFLKVRRFWEGRRWPSVHLVRPSLVVLSFFLALGIMELIVPSLDFINKKYITFTIDGISKMPQLMSNIIIISGLPIVFLVWLFRDRNNLWSIENQRKDVNLKDFQKLAEWASGLHLPEDKIVVVKKTTKQDKVAKDEIFETVKTEESSNSKEFSSEPAQGSLRTHSRRDGAIALQISAIHQLQAFLRGDFGAHFQRPAFQLVKAIWVARVKLLLEEMKDICSVNNLDWALEFQEWNKKIRLEMNSGVGGALTLALASGNGNILRDNSPDLPHIVLSGFDGMLLALQKDKIHRNIELYDLNLRGVQWQGANLKLGKFQRCDFFEAQLQSADLQHASLQGAQMALSDLRYAKLDGAKMQGANLGAAIIFGASLMVSDLRGVDFSGAILNGAKFNGANLEGAVLLNVKIDSKTNFSNSIADATTVVAVAKLKAGKYGQAIFPDDYDVDDDATIQLVSALKILGLPIPQAA